MASGGRGRRNAWPRAGQPDSDMPLRDTPAHRRLPHGIGGLWQSGRVALEDLREMIGQRVLVGITYLNAQGEVVDQDQFAGIVQAVEPLVAIDRGTDQAFTLPPEPDAFERGQPGEYKLRSTGETIVDPDYVSTWTVRAPTS